MQADQQAFMKQQPCAQNHPPEFWKKRNFCQMNFSKFQPYCTSKVLGK